MYGLEELQPFGESPEQNIAGRTKSGTPMVESCRSAEIEAHIE
jgi:hypothetical protein